MPIGPKFPLNAKRSALKIKFYKPFTVCVPYLPRAVYRVCTACTVLPYSRPLNLHYEAVHMTTDHIPPRSSNDSNPALHDNPHQHKHLLITAPRNSTNPRSAGCCPARSYSPSSWSYYYLLCGYQGICVCVWALFLLLRELVVCGGYLL